MNNELPTTAAGWRFRRLDARNIEVHCPTFSTPLIISMDVGSRHLLAFYNLATDLLASPAGPRPAPLPPGWKFNHAQPAVDFDGKADEGVWDIGWLEDGQFSPIITVDTGLYDQHAQAEPLARAILERLKEG